MENQSAIEKLAFQFTVAYGTAVILVRFTNSGISSNSK